MRRRKHATEDRGDDELTESLLVHGEEQQEEPRPQSRAIILYPGEFDLQVFVQTILDWWRRMIGGLLQATASLTHNLWPGAREEPLSLLQAERLQLLRERVAVRFDIGSSEHQEALRRLWGLVFPHLPCTELKTPQWKEMGWQGEDPATDFRGAGYYGLENLIYLGDSHPGTFRRLLDKSEGVRSGWEYPFAVAGLNVTFALADMLELHGCEDSAAAPRRPMGRSFARLLSESDVAFEELYVVTYCLLDATWLEMRASYMEFNAVLKRVRVEVEKALCARPDSLQALRARLLPNGAPGS